MRCTSSKPHTDAVKLVMLGAPAVGKSECTYKHETTVDDEAAHMEILDTAGAHKESSSQTEAHIRWGDGFILVYSITDRQSLTTVQRIKSLIDEIKSPTAPHFVLVGNKCDLVHDRQVSQQEGERVASDMGCGFFETSARDRGHGHEIEDVFHEVYRDVHRHQSRNGRSRRRSSSLTHQVSTAFSKMLTRIQNG